MSLATKFGPADLIGWLAHQCTAPVHCVECGAGKGEISAFLARRFHTVTATDLHPPRGAAALAKKAGFTYLSSPAETLPFDNGSVDLVISMQALHHFDVERHLNEARRILRSGGVFAALSWGEMQLPQSVARKYKATLQALEPYWEPERNWVVGGYDDLKFAGRTLSLPTAHMTKTMRYCDLDRHVAGLSASRKAAAVGKPLPKIDHQQTAADLRFEVSWPVVGRAFVT